uniref:Uncharacterized protein n=1 Tax=Setaria digitata TaxID=48799 RepID=A0A915PRW6_9BILA
MQKEASTATEDKQENRIKELGRTKRANGCREWDGVENSTGLWNSETEECEDEDGLDRRQDSTVCRTGGQSVFGQTDTEPARSPSHRSVSVVPKAVLLSPPTVTQWAVS